MGNASVLCPCGAVTGALGAFAMRECQGDFSHKARWARDYDVTQCLERYESTLDFCRVSEVSVTIILCSR